MVEGCSHIGQHWLAVGRLRPARANRLVAGPANSCWSAVRQRRGASSAVVGSCVSNQRPNPSIERTRHSGLRPLRPAAHVQR